MTPARQPETKRECGIVMLSLIMGVFGCYAIMGTGLTENPLSPLWLMVVSVILIVQALITMFNGLGLIRIGWWLGGKRYEE